MPVEGNLVKLCFKDCSVIGIKTILHEIRLRKHQQTNTKILLRLLKGEQTVKRH